MALLITGTIKNTGVSPNQTIGISSLSVTPAESHEQGGRDSIGTSEEEITIGADITTNGYLIMINRDDTNFVQVGKVTANYFADLPAGGVMLVPLDSSVSSLFLKADTAAVDVEWRLFESQA